MNQVVRFRLLLVGLLATACAEAEGPPLRVRDLSSAATLQCETIPELNALDVTPAAVTRATDSTFAVLYAAEGEVVLFDAAMQEKRQWRFDVGVRERVMRAEDLALLSDTAVVIADRPGQRLIVLGSNHTLRTIELPFLPQQVRSHEGQLFIVPTIAGRFPSSVLYRLVGDSVASAGIAPVAYGDLTTKMLGNLFTAISHPSGKLILAHQFFTPVAHVWQNGISKLVSLPVPEAVKATVGEIPSPPIDERALAGIYVGAIAGDADPQTGDVLLLTRSRPGGAREREKALLRLDSELRFKAAYILPAVNAGLFLYLPKRKLALFVDDEDVWTQCVVPA